MVLNNLILTDSAHPVNIKINVGKIDGFPEKLIPRELEPLQLTFDQALVFPGLINSHDHLDFNLFPQLGTDIYGNYTEWGKHIHENYPEEIAAVLKVPVALREQWGMLKNLICGVTMVVNHGEKVAVKDRLIHVHERYYCIHSVQFEKKWKWKLNHPLKIQHPVVIHIGEGTDPAAKEEIDQLLRWNLLHKTLIGVHAVAMSLQQVKKFKAIVWCPESNYFLLDKTAPVNLFKMHTKILFGTDSTLTGSWDIWEHIRLARGIGLLTDAELYQSLNLNPAATWETNNGAVATGKDADLIVTRMKDKQTGIPAFLSTQPKDMLLVLYHGDIRLFDASLYIQLMHTDLSGFSRITIDGAIKYVAGDLSDLIKKIKQYYPKARFPLTIN